MYDIGISVVLSINYAAKIVIIGDKHNSAGSIIIPIFFIVTLQRYDQIVLWGK